MKKLDLHGTRHAEAGEKIRTFLNFVDLPCQIVTGNSPKMKSIVDRKSACREKLLKNMIGSVTREIVIITEH